jgi:hypothetical protein
MGYVLLLRKNSLKVNKEAMDRLLSVKCDWMNGIAEFSPPIPEPSSLYSREISVHTGASGMVIKASRLKTHDTSKGFFIKSSTRSSIYIYNSNGTYIHFNTPGDGKKHLVWLDQCPLYHYATSDDKWTIKTYPFNLDFTFFTRD